nr:hypothetical protein [Tanacetum cinerariifolium]
MYKEHLAKFWYSAKTLDNSKVSFSVPTGGIYGEVGVNTFRNAIGAHYLPYSREYVAPPSINICLGGKVGGFDQITNKDAIILYSLANGINIDYASIFWEDIIIKLNNRHKEKVLPYTRFLSLFVMHKMKEGYGDAKLSQWYLKLSSPLPMLRGFLKAQSLELNLDTRSIKLSLKQPFVSSNEATGGPTFLGVTSEARANPQLISGMSTFNLNEPIYSSSFIIHFESASGDDALAVSTTEADLGKSAPSDFVPQQQGMNKGTKNTSYDHLFAGADPYVLADKTQSVSERLETILTQPTTGKRASSIARHVEEDEASRTINDKDKEADKVHATINIETEDTSVPKSLSPSSLPTHLKDLTSKLNELNEEVKELKKHVHELEIEELPAEFLFVPSQVEMVQAKLKTLDALRRQADTQPAEGENNTNQATISQLFQRKAAKNAYITKQQSKPTSQPTTPIILPIIPTTTQMQTPLQSPPKGSPQHEEEHIKKDKGKKAMSSEEAEKESTNNDSDDETHVTGSMVETSRIKKATKCDFVTEDGTHIHLTEEQINQQKKIEEKAKVEVAKHEKDGTNEVITNFKANDMHFGEWREVVKACPNRSGIGWKTIYGQKQTRMDYLHTTKVELGINLDIPLSEQDPLDKLNDLANKKRKHANDIHDYFKANKRLKSSIQYEDHLPGTMLNKPILGMIIFNSYHRQDFVTIKDLKDLSNTMLYTVQEIFFRCHQGPELDDYARTFSSLMLAEVDKRNLNLLKQMKTIEQLR